MIYQSSSIIAIIIVILVTSLVNSLEINNISGFPFLPSLDMIKPISGLVVISSYVRRSNIHNHQPRLPVIRSTIDTRFKKDINRNIQHSFNDVRKLGTRIHKANVGTTRGQEKNDITSQSSKHKSFEVSNMDMSFSTLFN
jgi:hypothetical protein